MLSPIGWVGSGAGGVRCSLAVEPDR